MHKVALVIGCPGDKNAPNYCKSVLEDVQMMHDWLEKHDFKTTRFLDTEATEMDIDLWIY